MHTATNVILILFDRNLRIISANNAFYQVSGYSYESLLSKPIAVLFQKFGDQLPFDFTHEPLLLITAKDEKHPVYGEICSLSQQSIFSQWALIGSIGDCGWIPSRCNACRGIIHDINNVLTVACAAMSLMDIESNSATAVTDCLKKKLWNALMTMNDLLVQLRNIGSEDSMMKTPCSVVDIIRRALDLAVFSFDTINVSISCDPNMPKVIGDEKALFRLFHNLFINSCEAMGKEGSIWVEINRVPKTLSSIATLPMIEVRIRDSGPGITVPLSDSIFSPFVSTKGKSRGMGLSIAKSIVERHGGTITVTPDSVFIIRFPAG